MTLSMAPSVEAQGAQPPHRTWIPPATLSERCEQDHHVLLWQVRGNAELVIDEKPMTLSEGHAAWVPAGVRHRFTVQANSVVVPLVFSVGRIATTLNEPTIIRVGRQLHTVLLAHGVAGMTAIALEANLDRQVLSLLERSPVAATAMQLPESAPARAVAETLLFNPGDIRTAEQLAASVHTSLRTVEREFRAETGMTLRQWRLRNRMQAAAVLLRTDTTVHAVAHRVGYTHVNAFRRAFKQHFGITPTHYAFGHHKG
ncbi:helix-turn-helix transcriptional regulator [Nesterenkonia ebinurensis]|uniref:helix-turn-helix transcriptional regulator n=1 Tax=Nesterenkonia ebinurensis TaxID=2608252 RepID=UPI001CC489A5|nr:AraC family transcriptional regulator [Nesterenkonia ebinurensis]